MAADLTTLYSGKRLLKHADNPNLVIPAVNTFTVQEEINHIIDWSSANNLTPPCQIPGKWLPQKIIHQNSTNMSDVIPGITWVQSLKVLGVFISDHSSASEHVTKTMCKKNKWNEHYRQNYAPTVQHYWTNYMNWGDWEVQWNLKLTFSSKPSQFSTAILCLRSLRDRRVCQICNHNTFGDTTNRDLWNYGFQVMPFIHICCHWLI